MGLLSRLLIPSLAAIAAASPPPMEPLPEGALNIDPTSYRLAKAGLPAGRLASLENRVKRLANLKPAKVGKPGSKWARRCEREAARSPELFIHNTKELAAKSRALAISRSAT